MTTPRLWRTVCQEEALAQSEAEARAMWRLSPEQAIPFNHRWEHVQSVVHLSLWLADQCGGDRVVLEAAGWLHDVRKQEPDHALAGAKAAQTILQDTDFPSERIEAVVDAIRKHEGLFRPSDAAPLAPIEAAVLWDADKLSKLGVEALALYLRAPYDLTQSLAQRRERLTEFITDVFARTVESMNTAPARQVAERRYQDMLVVMGLWQQEVAAIEP